MIEFLQVFYSIFSSLITSLAIPNDFIKFGSHILGLIALVPLYIAIYNAKTFNRAGLYTGLQLFLTHIMSSYWLGRFKDFAIFTLGASAVAYFGFGYVFGNYIYALFYYTDRKNPLKALSCKSFSFSMQQILGFASIWTIYEWFKSVGFLAYPWGTLFMTCYNWQTLKQVVSITGVLGITYMFALFSAVIARGIILIPVSHLYTANKTPIKFYALAASYCLVLFALSVFYGIYQLKTTHPVEKTMNVIMVQHNGEPWSPNSLENIEHSQYETIKALAEYEEAGEKCDLIVWSESTLSYGWFPEAYDKIYTVFPRNLPFKTFAENLKTPLLVGGAAHYPNSEKPMNSAILFDTEGKIVDFYGKHHLVPFAESIPYEDNPVVKKLLNKIVGFSNGWSASKNYVLFTIDNSAGKKITFSAPICFEDAFPDVCRDLYNNGSEVFVNITNDSWSETDSSEIQHFVISSFRTIEYRTSMIRSCVSGYSVVLDCYGNKIAELPLFTRAHLNTKVPIYKRTLTTYSVFGNWIMYVMFFYIIIYFIVIFAKSIKEQHKIEQEIQIEYEKNCDEK